MSLVSGPGRGGGSGSQEALCIDKHVAYIQSLNTRSDELEYCYTEHLRMNGVYWGLTPLHLMNCPNALPRDETIDFVLSCQHESGGFGAAPLHDAHMLYTVSAVQILVTLDALDELDKPGRSGKQKVASFIASLQDPESGVFKGDEWGEMDTRFLYGALLSLSLLGKLDLIDIDKAVSYIQKCLNLDGAYGVRPGAESHSGQVLTCVAALAIADRLDLIDKNRLGTWLSERQVDVGGLNGRPEKLEDVCYSWWVAASLAIIERLDWIDKQKLKAFILRCQDPDRGGLSDRPGNVVDVFHTHFGIAGLSLLGYSGLKQIDPVYEFSGLHYAGNKVTIPSAQLLTLLLSNNPLLTTLWTMGYKAREEQSICYIVVFICNKKPQFSDLSHLLTHISSKAHLANYFKLQVRSHHDPRSNETLIQYDQWYEENGLARLLSDRMASASRTSRRRRNIPSKLPFHIPEDKIDPRLSDCRQLLTPGDHIKSEVLSPASLSDQYERPFPKVEAQSPQWSEDAGTNGVGLVESTSNSLEERYNPFLLTARPKTPTIISENTQLSGSGFEISEEGKVDEMSRLKGVQWPGMNIFDAASDVMKRQRNQKKDASTFKAMEAASCATEPNEMVFSPSGTLRREREITGFVEGEEDLLPGEWSIPKHRRERRERRNHDTSTARSGQGIQRVALSVTDPNRSVLGSRVAKRELPKQHSLEEHRRRDYPLHTASCKPHSHGLSHGHCYPADDDDVDLQLSVGTTGRNRASRVHIFKDDDSAAAKPKINSPIPDIVENKTPCDEQSTLSYHQRIAGSVHSMLAANDPERLSPLSNNTSSVPAHNYSHNRVSAARELSRNIDGIYLVDNSLGPTHRVPYDPLVGGNVLHYRWDWNASDPARGGNDVDDPVLGGGMFYNRAASSDTTIYQDENENKSCLWLDGYSR
ncbi:hypothetical protein UA08_02463 [Talaromyces atroroseus]|uniref:Geranylgeranyl transferase type-2 subunit beta n=1 Tax=Talaromyces atroroseus TaxID=1441469 RepID=A0A225AQJ8_TALAT|nr:hypothetical protein UA08_02463 [Talaromyces atroroseus]OKL61773.1 hypothetical protein UA08_02463 [Talaromyces atroroseus]